MNKKSFPSGHNPYSLEHLENNRFQCLRISLRVFFKKNPTFSTTRSVTPVITVRKSTTKEGERTNKSYFFLHISCINLSLTGKKSNIHIHRHVPINEIYCG